MRLTDSEFKHILKAHGFVYETEHDNIYLDDMIVAVVDSIPDDDPEPMYYVELLRIVDPEDASTPALRAVCLLHGIMVWDLQETDGRN